MKRTTNEAVGPAPGTAPLPGGTPDRSGWRELAPEPAPAPTYWPAGAALGVVVLLWGTLTSPVLTGVGGALFALSLVRWIGEMLHDA